MVASVAGTTWSPGFALVEEVQQSDQVSPGKTDLVIEDGSVTAHFYPRDIIESIITPQINKHTPNFLYMDGNAPLHRVRIVTAHLQEVRVLHMVWPTVSPDLNPVEQVWDIVRLVRSPRRRCQAVIVANGRNTHY